MSEAMPDRDHEMLCDLAERAYALACKVQDQVMQAEDPATVSRLTGDFHRAARCVRQTIGLKARLRHDAERQDRAERVEAAREEEIEIAARRAQVGATVRRVIGEQYSGYDARELREDLEARLDEDALYGGFTDETVEDHVERVCDELGLAKPGETPPRRGPPLDPVRMARIHELLSRIPDDPEEDEDVEDEGISPPAGEGAPPEGGWRGNATPRTPPASVVRPAAEGPPLPAGEESAASTEPEPEPEPPPSPPDPEPDLPKPYIPPWEINPYARYPGGSGW